MCTSPLTPAAAGPEVSSSSFGAPRPYQDSDQPLDPEQHHSWWRLPSDPRAYRFKFAPCTPAASRSSLGGRTIEPQPCPPQPCPRQDGFSLTNSLPVEFWFSECWVEGKVPLLSTPGPKAPLAWPLITRRMSSPFETPPISARPSPSTSSSPSNSKPFAPKVVLSALPAKLELGTPNSAQLRPG